MDEKLKIFKALSDETRYNIVLLLLDGEKCVCEIFPYVKRTQSTVSIQLGKLEAWDILKSRRDGKKIYYKLKRDSVKTLFKALGYKESKSKRKMCCSKAISKKTKVKLT